MAATIMPYVFIVVVVLAFLVVRLPSRGKTLKLVLFAVVVVLVILALVYWFLVTHVAPIPTAD